jgi:hypothetical protein
VPQHTAPGHDGPGAAPPTQKLRLSSKVTIG